MQRVQIGRVSKPVGLKGELKVQSDFLVDEFFIGDQKYTVTKSREYNGDQYYYLDGIDTIEKAEKLKGKLIFANRDALNLDDDEILADDLIGFEVISTDGKKLGVVKAAGDNIDCGGFMFPYEDEFVTETNMTTKQIIVKKWEEEECK